MKTTETNQPTYTQGEWMLLRTTEQIHTGEWKTGIAGSILTCATAWGKTKEEAEGNAKRIVKCVNSHDALIENTKTLLSEFIFAISNQCKVLGMSDEETIKTINENTLIVKSRNILKQSEQE